MVKTCYLRPHYTLRVTAILHKIGEQAPYFSLTAEELYNRHHIRSCGCLHDLILKKYRGMADLVALRLSDINGVPMHAAANGLYWIMKGCNSFGKWSPAKASDAEALEIAAKHFRISLAEAENLRNAVSCAPVDARAAIVEGYTEACKPRWKAEADAAIAKYDLTVTTRY